MDLVFLDANVLFSAAYRDSAGLTRLWEVSDAQLITSAYAYGEALRNLNREQAQRLRQLVRDGVAVSTEPTGSLAIPDDVDLPAKDVPILRASICAGATHLVTGDVTHFGPYFGRTIEGVLVLRPRTYLLSKGVVD